MTRCAALTDDRQWLDCYYGAAQPMRAQLGLPPAPASQLRLLQVPATPASGPAPAVALPATVTRAAVRTGPPPMPKRSGIFDVFGGSDVVSDAPIQSYEVTGKGFTVTLPDGQVWRQTEEDAAKIPRRLEQPRIQHAGYHRPGRPSFLQPGDEGRIPASQGDARPIKKPPPFRGSFRIQCAGSWLSWTGWSGCGFHIPDS